jgi:hypothetical protein
VDQNRGVPWPSEALIDCSRPRFQHLSGCSRSDHRRDGRSSNHRRLSLTESGWLVWKCLFPDGCILPVHLGQSVQIFPPENRVPCQRVCVRSWKLDLRRVEKFHDPDCRTGGCRVWWCWSSLRSIYYHCLFRSTETAGSIHWSDWSGIWHGFCCWTPPGKSLTPLPRLLHQIPNKVSSDRGASSRIISLGAGVSTSIYRSEARLVASYSSSSRRQPLLNL